MRINAFTAYRRQTGGMLVTLLPVTEDDLPMFRRFVIEPRLIGPDWSGFGDAQAPARRFAAKAGFQLEGVIRACEFRGGQWRDGLLYSRLRDDPV